MKLVVNQAYDNMGLSTTQMFGSVMDTLMRNTPEARSFIEKANERGVPAAVADRDGPFKRLQSGISGRQANPPKRRPSAVRAGGRIEAATAIMNLHDVGPRTSVEARLNVSAIARSY